MRFVWMLDYLHIQIFGRRDATWTLKKFVVPIGKSRGCQVSKKSTTSLTSSGAELKKGRLNKLKPCYPIFNYEQVILILLFSSWILFTPIMLLVACPVCGCHRSLSLLLWKAIWILGSRWLLEPQTSIFGYYVANLLIDNLAQVFPGGQFTNSRRSILGSSRDPLTTKPECKAARGSK